MCRTSLLKLLRETCCAPNLGLNLPFFSGKLPRLWYRHLQERKAAPEISSTQESHPWYATRLTCTHPKLPQYRKSPQHLTWSTCQHNTYRILLKICRISYKSLISRFFSKAFQTFSVTITSFCEIDRRRLPLSLNQLINLNKNNYRNKDSLGIRNYSLQLYPLFPCSPPDNYTPFSPNNHGRPKATKFKRDHAKTVSDNSILS